MLDNAAFHNRPVDEDTKDGVRNHARAMIDEVKDLAQGDHDHD